MVNNDIEKKNVERDEEEREDQGEDVKPNEEETKGEDTDGKGKTDTEDPEKNIVKTKMENKENKKIDETY